LKIGCKITTFLQTLKYVLYRMVTVDEKTGKQKSNRDGYSIFEFYIVPSEDFLQELRTHGHQLEVLAPGWVREEMKWEVEEMKNMYVAN